MKSSHRVAVSALCVAASSLLFGCVTQDTDPDAVPGGGGSSGAGTGGSATAGSGGGTASNGGSSSTAQGGSTGGGGDPLAVACPTPTLALITDFSPPAPAGAGDAGAADAAAPVAATGISWGDYATTFSGSTYQYPNGTQMYALPGDFSANSWHVTGAVGNYSGLGIAFGPEGCSKVDAAAFGGIGFDISGSVGAPMGSTVTFTVGTSGNDITNAWLNANTMPATPAGPTFGRCIPAASQYDGTCASPSVSVPVNSTVSSVEIRWAQLVGGKPNVSVNPSELTFMSWVLPAPAAVGMPAVVTYDIDITIDNLHFLAL